MILIIRVMLLSFILTAPALAEKLVDPAIVAPEYRDAAEKRRAEQIRQRECAHKADIEKGDAEGAHSILAALPGR